MITVFADARVFDGISEELQEGSHVVVEGGTIREVATSQPNFRDARVVDCAGRVLMPGLIDAHFHAYTPSFDFNAIDRMPPGAARGSHAARILEGTLQRGFTSVRDARRGGDIGLALAIEQGLIRGPRFFCFAGKALSQTGGHGDVRRAEERYRHVAAVGIPVP